MPKLLLATLFSLTLLAPVSFSTMAHAGSECNGFVRGLSNNYNPSKGSGFLAVRSLPSTQEKMLAHLFNGDRIKVEQYSDDGRWLLVLYNGGQNIGWVFSKFIRETC